MAQHNWLVTPYGHNCCTQCGVFDTGSDSTPVECPGRPLNRTAAFTNTKVYIGTAERNRLLAIEAAATAFIQARTKATLSSSKAHTFKDALEAEENERKALDELIIAVGVK